MRGRGRLAGMLGLLVALAATGDAACDSSNAATPAAVDAGHDVDAGGSPFTEEEIRAAATAFETKSCGAFERCDPIRFHRLFGSMSGCLGTALPFSSFIGVYAFGSLLTPDALRACAAAIDLSTCDAWVRLQESPFEIAECRALVYGTLPDGSPCASWNQCASGRCLNEPLAFRGPPGTCGRCVPQQPMGAPCQYYLGCVAGSTCRGKDPQTSICTPFSNVGEPCDTYKPCHWNLLCAGDRAGSTGTCVVPPADSKCDVAVPVDKPACSEIPALRYCNPATKTCDPIPLVNAGERCGWLGQEPFVHCSYESRSTCTLIHDPPDDAGAGDGGPPPLGRFVCMPLIEDGEACNADDHPHDPACKNGEAVCFQRVCQRNGPAECTPPPVLP